MVTLTCVIAIVGVVQAIALVFTLRATQRAARATQQAADAATKSNISTEEALNKTERAYLAIEQINIPDPLGVPAVPRIVVWLANRGRTPATIISSFSDLVLFDRAPERPAAFTSNESAPILVAAGAQISNDVDTEYVVTLDDLKAVNAGLKAFVVWGSIVYVDVFQKRHQLNYGSSMHFMGKSANGRQTVSFKYLEGGGFNSSD